MTVGNILTPGVEQALVLGMVCEIKLHAVGVDAPTNSFTELLAADVDLSCLHHLVGAKAVQMGKGDLPHQLVKRFLRFETTGFYVTQVIENIPASRLLLF